MDMFELISKFMDYSFAPNVTGEGPEGISFFIFLVLVAITIIWVSHIIFEFFQSAMISMVKWRSNVAESRAKAKKNDMAPSIIEGQIDLHFKIDQLSAKLEDGIVHLSNKAN
tara:strand:+ start:2763 stop:3098 length:336 start_codon:yes stop_codon:yes gene_type:complete